MITLSSLTNFHRPKLKVQRVGRGMGSKRGKTCCRGTKGDKARRGYKCHFGREGGQLPLYRKLPCKGFTNGRFQSEVFAINFTLINEFFNDGEIVSYETLRQKGLVPRRAAGGIKLLGSGEIQKKVSIQVSALSKGAQEQLEKKSISYKLVGIE
jgi:large subunit ribosomal protein L15